MGGKKVILAILSVAWLLVPDGPVCTEILTGISQSAQLLGFSRTTISRVYKEWCDKGKHPVCGSPVGENALLMLEVRGEWAD